MSSVLNALTGLLKPQQSPVTDMPNTEAVSSLPREERKQASRIAKWFEQQYQEGLRLRRHRVLAWEKCYAILRGIHYFDTSTGRLIPIPHKYGEIRSIAPVMKPAFRQELGRFNANPMGVTVTPASGGTKAIYKADRGQNILTHWIDEIDLQSFFDEANQLMLIEGGVGYHPYKDSFRQQVYVKAIPQSSLFPIYPESTTLRNADGLIVVSFQTKAWLEQQDEKYARANPGKTFRKMADQSSKNRSEMIYRFQEGSSDSEGAYTKTVWMNPSEDHPNGEYLFMVEDELFRYNRSEQALPKGRIPVEHVTYNKRPDTFWGDGFCEDLIGTQLAKNRTMTQIERTSEISRGYTLYNDDAFDEDKLTNSSSLFIPFHGSSYEKERPPIINVPAQEVSRGTLALFQVFQDQADIVSGYRSGIVFGQAEGRVEAGTAVNQLNANAQAPIIPALVRMNTALRNTYTMALDMIREVWPDNKVIRVSGPNNTGKEISIKRDDIPWSQEVIIKPIPLLPNGSAAMLNILFQLRQMPGQDGVPGSEVSSREFRLSLKKLDMLPPSMDLTDRPENRIQDRINRLIGDGNQPQVAPANLSNPNDPQRLEDHRMAIEMTKNAILHPSFELYSQQVQRSLYLEFQFHNEVTLPGGGQPNQFGDDQQQVDSQMTENFLQTAGQDLTTTEGEFQFPQMVG